ncbi:AAA family ATPase [Spirosoma jeollabukense]
MHKFIISGGPGAGKSTLLNALRDKGFCCVDEVSRQLIQQEVAAGSHCLPWVDLSCFARMALDRMIRDFEKASDNEEVTFFDRAIPDIIAYLRIGDLPVGKIYYQAVKQYAYQPQVFMAPPWEAIYVNDNERWQTFAEATALHQALVTTYRSLGFEIIELPLVSVSERVEFVEKAIAPWVERSNQEDLTFLK